MQNPVRGLLHGTAAVASAIGMLVLMLRAGSWPGRLAFAVFGLGLVGLFTTSTLYHSVPWREKWTRRMQALDQSMIFVLIAATYTPIAVVVLGQVLGWVTIAVVWTIALFGIGLIAVTAPEKRGRAIALMMVLGWLSLPLMVPVAARVGLPAVVLLALGGIMYTLGMVSLVTGRPRLWPRVFSAHEVFHVLVVAAAALHFTVAYRYVLPLD